MLHPSSRFGMSSKSSCMLSHAPLLLISVPPPSLLLQSFRYPRNSSCRFCTANPKRSQWIGQIDDGGAQTSLMAPNTLKSKVHAAMPCSRPLISLSCYYFDLPRLQSSLVVVLFSITHLVYEGMGTDCDPSDCDFMSPHHQLQLLHRIQPLLVICTGAIIARDCPICTSKNCWRLICPDLCSRECGFALSSCYCP
jgi:hypothetical protein